MGTSTCLLSIEPYLFSGEEIGEVKKAYRSREYWRENLPKYCFNKQNSKILPTEYYHQFTEDGMDQYLLFDINTVDRILQEEISQCGFEELFTDSIYDMPQLYKLIMNKFKLLDYDDYRFKMFTAEYVKVLLIYSEPDHDGDIEMETNIGEFLKL